MNQWPVLFIWKRNKGKIAWQGLKWYNTHKNKITLARKNCSALFPDYCIKNSWDQGTRKAHPVWPSQGGSAEDFIVSSRFDTISHPYFNYATSSYLSWYSNFSSNIDWLKVKLLAFLSGKYRLFRFEWFRPFGITNQMQSNMQHEEKTKLNYTYATVNTNLKICTNWKVGRMEQ